MKNFFDYKQELSKRQREFEAAVQDFLDHYLNHELDPNWLEKVGKLSGRAAFRDKLKQLGYDLGDNAFQDAFRRFKDLADKTRRGLRGRVEEGKSGGGLCFGYDVVKQFALIFNLEIWLLFH